MCERELTTMHVIIMHNTIHMNSLLYSVNDNCNNYYVFTIAVMGNDFTLHSVMSIVTFSTGSANTDSQCIDISITTDDIYEENQVFSVSIGSVSLTTAAVIGTPSSITITIQDNNG